MWTLYSMVNSVCKGKYGSSLQKHPRITSLLKSYDTDVKKKAAVFSQEDVDSFVKSKLITTPYWLVRKVLLTVGLQLSKWLISLAGIMYLCRKNTYQQVRLLSSLWQTISFQRLITKKIFLLIILNLSWLLKNLKKITKLKKGEFPIS